ncbi:MAG: hypothetical protein KF764_05340 [Labilithrix sp.]|nr:hypothetical protein [Labilithrix sp.]
MPGPLSSRLFVTVLVGGLSALLACSRASNGAPPAEPTPDGGVFVPAELDAYIEELASRCATVEDDAPAEATLREARAAYKRGETDIALSVKGCTRLFVQRSGDREVFSAVLSPPFGVSFDNETMTVKRTAAMISWSTGPDGKTEVRGDLDGDGIAELRESAVPGASLVSELTDARGTVKQRTRAKVAADGLRVEVTEESETDGRLGVTATYEGARVARKCTGDPTPGSDPPPATPPRPASPFPESPHEIACSPEQLQKLDALLEQATNGGSACMEATGMLDIRFRLLRQMATTSFDFKCTDDPTFVAANDGGYGNVFGGRALIWINPLLFTAVNAEQVATLYHELMHFFFVHDHQVEALAPDLSYADRVYACEQLCFGKKANRCHLAACTKKKICEVDKTGFERRMGKEIEACWTGHQVGALCRKKPGERLWCTTKAECDAACGGQECESKSISCNQNCR